MNHVVNSVDQLHEDSLSLHQNFVVGDEEFSADYIIRKLALAIKNLKQNWKGADAGKNISVVILVYNNMVSIRNALAQLVVQSTKLAAQYREIQNSCGASLDELSVLSIEEKPIMENYIDETDVININESANQSKIDIETAKEGLLKFKENIKSKYDEIMENWRFGPGRNSAEEELDFFLKHVTAYQNNLVTVSNEISDALAAYGSINVSVMTTK